KWLIGDFDSTLLNTALLNKENIDGAYGVTSTVQDYADSPGAKVCSQILTDAGLPPLRADNIDQVVGWECEEFIDAMQIANLAGPNLTRESYAQAATKAGNLFAAQVYGVRYGKDDLTGGDKVALMRFDAKANKWNMGPEGVVDTAALNTQ